MTELIAEKLNIDEKKAFALWAAAAVAAALLISWAAASAVFGGFRKNFEARAAEAAAQLLAEQEAARAAVSGGEEFALLEGTELLEGVSELYGASSGAVIVEVTSRGFESDVTLNVGIDAEGRITGISVVSQGETPERGGQALAEDYLSQFTGLEGSSGVDAFTGATHTSEAVFACVDTAVNQYRLVNGLSIEKKLTAEDVLLSALAEHFPQGYEQIEVAEPVKYVDSVYSDGADYAVYTVRDGYYEGYPIKMLVYVGGDGKIAGAEAIEQHETPDNGAQAFNDGYYGLYVGSSQFYLFEIPGFEMPGMKIDTLTGATQTCYSIFDIMTAAAKQVSVISK